MGSPIPGTKRCAMPRLRNCPRKLSPHHFRLYALQKRILCTSASIPSRCVQLQRHNRKTIFTIIPATIGTHGTIRKWYWSCESLRIFCIFTKTCFNISVTFKAIPYQVTTAELKDARDRLAKLQDLDPSSIEAMTLAAHLQGISRAVSTIVSQGTIEYTRLDVALRYDPATMPQMEAHNIIRHYDNPTTKTGRMFAAQPSRGFGACIGVNFTQSGDQN